MRLFVYHYCFVVSLWHLVSLLQSNKIRRLLFGVQISYSDNRYIDILLKHAFIIEIQNALPTSFWQTSETGKQVSDTVHQVYLEMPFFTKKEAEYEEALKIYRDNQGVLDYALESGYAKGKAEWTSNPFADVPGLLPKRGVSQVGYTSLFLHIIGIVLYLA